MACDQVGRAVWNSRRALPGVLMALLACGEAAGPNPPSSNPVASISITPSSDTVILALSVQLSAVVRDSSDTALSGYAVVWASSDPTVATVSATGLVGSVGLGVGHDYCHNGTRIAYIGTQPTPPPWPGMAVMAGDATGSLFITGAQNAIATVQTQNPGGGQRWRP